MSSTLAKMSRFMKLLATILIPLISCVATMLVELLGFYLINWLILQSGYALREFSDYQTIIYTIACFLFGSSLYRNRKSITNNKYLLTAVKSSSVGSFLFVFLMFYLVWFATYFILFLDRIS